MNVTIFIQLPKARSCEITVIYIFSNTCVSHTIYNPAQFNGHKHYLQNRPKTEALQLCHVMSFMAYIEWPRLISKSYKAETETPQLSHQLQFLALQSFLQSEAHLISPYRCAQNLEPSGEGPPNDAVHPQILSFGLPC